MLGTLLSMITAVAHGRTFLSVTIYPEKTVTTAFVGNGVQWSAYPHADSPTAEWGLLMTDRKWERIFSRLDYMKPAMVRVMDQANWRYLKGFDPSGKPILEFQSLEVKALEKLLTYCQKKGIAVLLGEWGCPYQVHDQAVGLTGKFTGANDQQWIDIIVQFLDYLINKKEFSCIKYYNLINEPNGNWASTNGNWDEWSQGIRLLKTAFDRAGLSDKISIIGPDVVAHYDHPQSKYTGAEWVAESVKQLNDCVGLYDIHTYPDLDLVRSGRFSEFYRKIAGAVKSTGKPIVCSELGFNRDTPANQRRVKKDKYASEDSQMSVYDFSYGIDMADALVQLMKCGYGGALAWDLDDAMHTKDDKGDPHQLKRWGFWNSLGTELCHNPDDENIRPWFYTWSLMCRYFPQGINIVESDSTKINGLRIVAGYKEDNMSIAIINNTTLERRFTIKTDKRTAAKLFKKYIYSATNRPVDKDSFPIPVEKGISSQTKNDLSVNIPASGFILYTTFDY
jgi:hypothetical protein